MSENNTTPNNEQNPTTTPATNAENAAQQNAASQQGNGQQPNNSSSTPANVQSYTTTAAAAAAALGTIIPSMKNQMTSISTDLKSVTADSDVFDKTISAMNGIAFDKVIGSPIQACIDAQKKAARSTLDFIQEVGMTEKDGTQYAVVVTFDFFAGGKMKKMSIPLLTLVPIPTFGIETMTYDFKVHFTSSSQLRNTIRQENASKFAVNLWDQEHGEQQGADDAAATGGANGDDELMKLHQAFGNDGKAEVVKDLAAEAGKTPAAEAGKTPAAEAGKTPAAEAGKTPAAEAGKTPAAEAGKGADKGTKAEGAKAETPKTTDAADAKKAAAPTFTSQPNFSATISTKKDSIATKDSKYSVEATMDIKITAGRDSMPAGISTLLRYLNDSVDIYDPNGTLEVSPVEVSLTDGRAAVNASYKNGDGVIDLQSIKVEGPSISSFVFQNDCLSMVFTAPGTYTVSAEKCSQTVIVKE